MSNPIAIMLLVLAAYAAVGVVFAAVFVVRGVGRIDAVAAHAPLRVRLIFAPGTVALWPLLARKWMAAAKGPTQ